MGVFQIDGNERTWKTAGNFHEHKNSWGYLEDELPVTWVPLRPTFFINGWMEMVNSKHFLYKDLVHHPTETSI